MPTNTPTPVDSYPSGIYAPENLNVEPEAAVNPGDDPSWVTSVVEMMSRGWVPIDLCVGGTQAFRANAAVFLPQEPAENQEAWERRVSHATLSPYTVRIAEQAAGLICRKPIQLQSKDKDGELDPYWEDFAQNVDGFGTSVDAFARNLVLRSVLYGHAAVLCDYPSTEAALNLADERQRGLRPYFINVGPHQILGWRRKGDSPTAPLSMVRILERVSENLGEFGDKEVIQVRVLERGRWRVYREGANGWQVYQEGETSLKEIPLAVTYSQKVAELVSKPPLTSIANLNIAHGQRTADLSFSLHIAALPLLVLQGFDDADSEIGLSANTALLLPIDGKASYVEPASSAFQSQQNYITQLEEQMSNLGISTLFSQKMAAETAASKELSRSDSDSLLSVVSQDLQQCIQDAFDMAAAYVGIEAPRVTIDRDFNLQTLDGAQIQNYMQLWMNGAITQATLLSCLKTGEILPAIDVEEEVELTAQEKQDSMALVPNMMGSGGEVEEKVEVEEKDEDDGSDEEMRKILEERLRPKARDNGEKS